MANKTDHDNTAPLIMSVQYVHDDGFSIFIGQKRHFGGPDSFQRKVLNPGPAGPEYAPPLQTMQIQISWLLQKPTDLNLHCL